MDVAFAQASTIEVQGPEITHTACVSPIRSLSATALCRHWVLASSSRPATHFAKDWNSRFAKHVYDASGRLDRTPQSN